jgi:hypothetical protein
MNQFSQQLEQYHVVSNSPSKTDRGFVPLGNGEVGVCLWVEEDGDLQMYIGRSDALTELDRNVKLGKIRIRLHPNPFASSGLFRQELALSVGMVQIEAGMPGQGSVRIKVFVDCDHPTVHVIGECDEAVQVSAIYETWRLYTRAAGADCGLGNEAPVDIVESPDVVITETESIVFYHRNQETCIPFHAELQGVGEHIDAIPDTLTNRIFGGCMSLTDGTASKETGTLESVGSVRTFAVRITTDSRQTIDPADWIRGLTERHARSGDVKDAERRTMDWWKNDWVRSWIFVEGDECAERSVDQALLKVESEAFQDIAQGPSAVTRAYVLTRWMQRCSDRGELPIMFNGSLFTVMPGGNQHYSISSFGSTFTAMPAGQPDMELNPDERPWRHMQLWQNIRLPYLSMLARGEFEAVRVLFRYYGRFAELNRLRARIYHDAEGQHNTEITTSFGLIPAGVFGIERTEVPVGYSVNRWGGAVDVSPGLELLFFMLDYYEYTNDNRFLQTELLPYGLELFRYIETRFKEREDGKLVLSPLNAVETYRDTADPMPTVAGMHAVLDRILALPSEWVSDRAYYEDIRKLTPELPEESHNGEKVLSPARQYGIERMNVESPEKYAIFPFRLFGLGKPELSTAERTYRRALKTAESFRPFILGMRPDYASFSGWQQTGIMAAMLGLSGDARTVLTHNAALNNPGYRYPAMWGPIYDSVPDIDHGANLMNTLQAMLLQAEGRCIRLLPAWPSDWDVWFKLHAPVNTTVECRFRDGRIVKLVVDPPERLADVVMPELGERSASL